MNKTFVLLGQLLNLNKPINKTTKQGYEIKENNIINKQNIPKFHRVSYKELRESAFENIAFSELFLEEKFNKVQKINLMYSEIETLIYLKERIPNKLVQELKELLETYERIDWPAVKSVKEKAIPTRTVLTHFGFIERTLKMSRELCASIKQVEVASIIKPELARAQEVYTMAKMNLSLSLVPSRVYI